MPSATEDPSPLHQVAIVGVYNTRQARAIEDRTSLELVLEAARGALADAGPAFADVDGFHVTAGSGYPAPPPGWRVSPYQFRRGGPAWQGSAPPGLYAFVEAAAAIAAGLCETVLIAAGQTGHYRDHTAVAPWTRPSNEFVECWGMTTPAQFALAARHHMHLFGTAPEQLAEVASVVRTNGNATPGAVYEGRGVVTPADVLASRMVADPFHLLDCATTSEGACAMVLTTRARARDRDGPAVFVHGAASEIHADAYSRPFVWAEYGWTGTWAAAKAFAAARCRPEDIDVLELYDAFSFEIIHQLEAFGFCPRGEGGPFVADGRTRPGGSHPITTDGGTMAFGHCGAGQTLQRAIAAVVQLRGEAGDRQVPGATRAIASGGGHTARDVVILGSEPASG
jgi:acetyl-CoA acetyltransferase